MSGSAIINLQVTAVNSESFNPAVNKSIGFVSTGLSGSEAITVQIYNGLLDPLVTPGAIGDGYQNYIVGGVPYTLTAGSPSIEIWQSSFVYRLSKPITANPAGVWSTIPKVLEVE